MSKIRRRKGLVFLALVLALVWGAIPVFAEAKTVNNFAELKTAVENPNVTEITINGEIEATKTLEIRRNIKISGGTLKLASTFSSDQMFKVEENKTLNLKDITLNGNEKGRLIYVDGGTVNLEKAILKNGSTQTFKESTTHQQNYSGGAILSLNATINIKGGEFINNKTGMAPDTSKSNNGEGGAIKLENSTLTINDENSGKATKNMATTKFIGNGLGAVASKNGRGGLQGGAIEATKTTVKIYGTSFRIPGPFNTGGAIKFEDCSSATLKNSYFEIDANKGNDFGVAGGAITSEGSNLTIDNSDFKAGDGTRVLEAGGLIQVCLGGTFDLTNSTLEGAGAWWNAGKYTANTGGAISFYDDSSVTAKIENTTIKNFMVDGNGAGIALSKGNGHESKVNLTLKDSKILNTAAYTFGNSYAGGMYIGKGNTVKMDGGQISSDTASYVVSGIYNMGDLEITGGALIINNFAYRMVGGIYHDGTRLKIDKATISGNQVGDWSTGDKHMIGEKEKGGINVYADKDVIITPEASFDGNDVRVLDGQSSILLTGPLTKQINVSISESEKESRLKTGVQKIFEENQHRKVGYIVAKGTEGYTPNENDAEKIHYVTNDTSQPVAEANDHISIGKWDFVLNQATKNVVLGQRVKVTLYPNGTEESLAEFKNVKNGRVKNKGIITKLLANGAKEDVYEIYASEEKSAELIPEPVRTGYGFTGWYKEEAVKDDAPDKNKEGKTLVEDLKLVNNDNEITTIINPNEYKLYAGWEKIIPVKKVWEDNKNEFGNRPDSVTVKLFLGDKDLKNEVELTAENGWKGEFKNLPEGNIDSKNYEVHEEQQVGYKAAEITGDDKDGFTVTNSTEFITIEGNKTWNHGSNPTDKQPTSVTVKLSDGEKEEPQTVNAAKNWTWKFENLPKYKNKNLVTYTLKEAPVDNYTSTQDGYNFTNTYTNKFKVIYQFKPEDSSKTLPKGVMDQLPKEETGKSIGAEVTPSTTTFTDVAEDDGTWSFKSWDKQTDTIKNSDVTFTGTWTFTEKESSFTVTKTVDKDEFKKAGEVLTYTVTVKNTGEKKLENLAITDSLVKLTEKSFTLDVGEEKTFTYTYTVTEEDVKEKKVKNTATVTLDKESKEDSATSKFKEEPEKPKPPVENTITEYVDTQDKKLLPPKDGDQPKEVIPGYEYIKTEKTTAGIKTTIRHIYKKIVKDGPPKITFWTYPKASEPVSDKGLLNKEDHKAYMFGYPDKTFGPDRNMTREEVTTMFARLLKDYPRARRTYAIPYSDVSQKDWSYEAIGFMTEKGMIKGYEDGTFRPKEAVTRAEFATIASRFDALRTGEANRFSDLPETHWAVEAINSAAAKGWVKGYPDGTFKPDQKITRSEVVSITNIMLDRFADKDFVRSHLHEMIEFTDLTEGNWAYFPIMEATHGHDYTRKAAEQEENWIRLNGEEFWFPALYAR